ncbi:MAG TPA: FAD-dependent oxidoreductase [Kineosporiaceae bacterium]
MTRQTPQQCRSATDKVGVSSGPEVVAVAVIGAGAAGVAAARAAATALGPGGGRVVLIGDRPPGGGARLVTDAGLLRECAERGLDWYATVTHLRSVRTAVDDASREAALRADGVDLVRGHARLLGDGRIEIEAAGAPHAPAVISARRIVLATGDEDRLPAVSGLQDTRYATAATLLSRVELPPTAVIVGGGPHGCELAQALARFGVSVTLVEGAARLLPGDHPEASAQVAAALRADGVRVFTAAQVVKVAPTLDGGAWVGTGSGGDFAAEALILATGRRAAVRGLNLPAAGVLLTGAGWVGVDDRLVTSGPGVLAVGRVTGLLPHGTGDPVMARVAGTNAASRRPTARWTPGTLPRVVRTDPPVAAVGVTVDEARTIPGARVSQAPYRGPGGGPLAGPAGLITLVAGPARSSGWVRRGGVGSPLLGAAIVGPQAGELSAVVALGLHHDATVEDLAAAPLSSRTWAMALQQAASGFPTSGSG